MCFAQTAALGGFCAEGWATGEETYGLSEWRSRRKSFSQHIIATDRTCRECNIFRCEIYEKWCFGTYQTDPECFLGAILAQDIPRFVMIFCRFGVPFWTSVCYDFLSIWGATLEVENGIKIDPEIKTFLGIPRNFVFYDRRPQKRQNEVPKLP